MGYAVNNFCYSSLADAALADCGSNYPKVQPNAFNPLYVFCQSVTSSSLNIHVRPVMSASSTSYQMPLTYPACDPATYPGNTSNPFLLSIESGSALGGAILLVMGVAWVMRMVRKSVESHYIERDES